MTVERGVGGPQSELSMAFWGGPRAPLWRSRAPLWGSRAPRGGSRALRGVSMAFWRGRGTSGGGSIASRVGVDGLLREGSVGPQGEGVEGPLEGVSGGLWGGGGSRALGGGVDGPQSGVDGLFARSRGPQRKLSRTFDKID